MSDKLKAFFNNSLGYLAVALVSVIYVLAGMFVPGFTGKSLYTILAEGVTGFILGVSMNYNLKLQGILKGKNSPEMAATRKEHGIIVNDIAPQIDGLEAWCAERNAEALRQKRTRILTGVGMCYATYFREDGTPLECDTSTLSKKQKKAYRKALKARITLLSTSSLTCDGESAEDPYNFGETPAQYQRRTNLTDAFSKLLTAAVFGYFGVDMVENFDAGALVWRALYVALLLALGVSKMLSAYLFVTDTYRGGIIKKINHLQAYKNCAQDYVRREREEKENGEHDTVHAGSVQDGCTKGAGAQAGGAAAVGGHQPSEAAQIPAAADQGVQHRHDGDRQDRSE